MENETAPNAAPETVTEETAPAAPTEDISYHAVE